MNSTWPRIDLYITWIVLCSKVRLQQRAVVSDGQRGDSCTPQNKDEKGASTRLKFIERSVGRF